MSCCAVCDTTVKFDFGTDHVLLLCPTNKKIHLYILECIGYVIRNLCACVCDVNICFLSHDMWCNCDQFYVDIIVILYQHPLLHCTRSPIDWNVTSRGVKNCIVYLTFALWLCTCPK